MLVTGFSAVESLVDMLLEKLPPRTPLGVTNSLRKRCVESATTKCEYERVITSVPMDQGWQWIGAVNFRGGIDQKPHLFQTRATSTIIHLIV